MAERQSFDIDGLMVFRSDLTAVDQDGNTVASVTTPDKYVPSLKEPLSGEQIGRYTNTISYWREHSTYVPLKGEVIIYSDGGSITEGGTTVYIPKIKIGDGVTTVGNLPFTDSDTQQGMAGTLDTTNTSAQTPSSSESLSGNVNLHKVSKTGDYGDLLNKPTIPTVNDAVLTVQRNSTTVDTFSANASQNKTINITVPTTASDVSALPASTKYGASISLTVNQTTFVVTAQLKDQDGNNLGNAQTIDLPLESVVVSGSYNAQTKKVVLTLQNGSTIEFSVADLVAGLQSEITAQNPLSADLVVDGTTNKVFTLTMKTKLDGIEAGAEANVQADWSETDTTSDAYILHKPDLDATLYEPVTYSQLVSKINNSQLVKGRKYRITDYVTTTTQTNTSSAGHAFDLVVTAIDVNKLDCKASALLHSGDTYFSTAGANLNKWQIWYDVKNDTTKYAWADSTNGKGVIYRMIDEWGNDCPYDFKNIMIGATGSSVYTYTFNALEGVTSKDGSLNNIDGYDIASYFNNSIKPYRTVVNDIVVLSINMIRIIQGGADLCNDNVFGQDCYNITFASVAQNNKFGERCHDMGFGVATYNNTFGNNCYNNTFGANCVGNTFGNNCFNNNTLGEFQYNVIGNNCSYNEFGQYCNYNRLCNDCASNVFKYSCGKILLKDNCFSIIFGNSSNPSEGGSYCKDIIVESSNRYIRIYNTASANSSNSLQNIYIAQGCSGTSSAYTKISTIERGLSYRTTVGRDSSGNIRIYNEDDPQVQANWNESNSSSPSYIQNKPTIPSAPGTLNTTNTTAQSTSSSEALSGTVNLHKVAKTGTYSDLIGTPTIPTLRTVNHEQLTDSSLGDINIHDGFYFPNAVQDYDGNWYGAVVIGDQVWLGENLRTTHYADGTEITNGGSSTSSSTAYYYDYSTSSIPLEKRGYLYNWPAVMNGAASSGLAPSGVQGIAPNGWHVPSYTETNNLVYYVQKQSRFIYSNSPTKISKSLASTSYWNTNATAGNTGNDQSTNNATGLNLYPAGHKWGTVFEYSTYMTEIYTTTESSSENAYSLGLNHAADVIVYSQRPKRISCSVRCVSNLTPLQFRDWYVKTYGTLQHHIEQDMGLSVSDPQPGQVLMYNETTQYFQNMYEQNIVFDTEPSVTSPGNRLLLRRIDSDTMTDGWYGVEIDTTDTNPAIKRIGSYTLHRTLPIQSGMRRCLLLDDGTVNYYLSATNSAYKEDGTTAAVLDGTDGQVMVEIPAHYRKFEIEGTKQRVKISPYHLPGYTYVDKSYYSAFEAALDRTNLKLSSVVNTTAQYRGGNNTSSWDGTYRSLLGMPATSTSLTSFRTYAHNRGTGWQCHDNNIYEIVCNLYIIEYANTNCQLAFNASPIASGDWARCKQGGLGSGVTGMPDWSTYNSYNPVVPCGVTVTLGNATGVVTYNVIASDGSTVKYAAPVPSYRGIENLFGHIWKHTDAILVNIQSAGSGGKSMVYKCTDPTKYSSTLTADYVYVGDEARSEGWTKNVLTPCMVCSEVGADSSTGYADYHYTSIPSSGSSLRAVLFGGNAYRGAMAGFACLASSYNPSHTFEGIGSRLCYIPQ